MEEEEAAAEVVEVVMVISWTHHAYRPSLAAEAVACPVALHPLAAVESLAPLQAYPP